MFVLDSNVFIEAHRRYYNIDICPGFWDSLLRSYQTGKICSVQQVKDELKAQNDYVANWIKESDLKLFFPKTDDEQIIKIFQELMEWVNSQQQFKMAAKEEFADVADGWIIAYAKCNHLTVVTEEVYKPGIKIRVPIPNVCKKFEIPYINTFEMLRRLETSFHLID